MSDGHEYEAATASRFQALGWNTQATAATGDWGADVVCYFRNERLVVQCNDWGNPVGLSAVQEVFYARIHYCAQLAAVVAKSGYTKAAKQAATAAGAHLLTLHDLRVGSSILDRSKQGAQLHEEKRRRHIQEAEFEYEKRATLAWYEFDRAVATRQLLRPWLKTLGFAMIFVGCAGAVSFAVALAIAILNDHAAFR